MTADEPASAATDAGSPLMLEYTSLAWALRDSIASTPHLPRDRAMLALAFRYADLIDDAADRTDEADEEEQARNFGRMVAVVAKIGPRLEAVLHAMGMAPGARAATRAGDPQGVTHEPDNSAAAALRQLQSDAAAPVGIDHAAFVDPAVAEADAAD